MSPALAGGFLTTAPPGKPNIDNFLIFKIFYFWVCGVFIVARGIFVAVRGLLMAVASLVAEHGL